MCGAMRIMSAFDGDDFVLGPMGLRSSLWSHVVQAVRHVYWGHRLYNNWYKIDCNKKNIAYDGAVAITLVQQKRDKTTRLMEVFMAKHSLLKDVVTLGGLAL